ncbi:hypothetical protein FO440_14275 [Mucilaginibacter corticis]|uniref:DUF5723 domain-containing protein n=1 Tax=Mucilaginibacter corticis TaxID=2597670 RepID=A0A556MLV2_9SPHI|nr:hypothetical protein [Mucilaginibacter corticis]TSJ40901.1 hypothetical protein FO440_14275 [Mucilaginibacter corticis]
MKKYFLLMVLIAIVSVEVRAQDSVKFKAGWGNLDYSIPESPAFKILGTDPDNILKPSSVRSVALSIGNYFVTNGAAIPKSLAVEISPLLLNGNASLNDYNKNKFLYRARLSFGTSMGDKGSYSTAEGIRFTIIDKTDLRTNTAYLKDILASLGAAVNAEDKAIPAYIKQNNLNISQIAFREQLAKDTVLYNKLLAFETQFIPDDIVKPADMEKLRNKYRESLWNAPTWEAGLATLQTSKDSLLKNLKTSQVGLWTSAGLPVGKKGQVLIGAKFAMADSVGWQKKYSAGARYYYGSNSVKGFAQVQFDRRNNANSTTASVGCDFNIANGIWGQAVFNFIDLNGTISYQPGFNIGFGTGEKKHS